MSCWKIPKYLSWIKDGCQNDTSVVHLELICYNFSTIPRLIENLQKLQIIRFTNNELESIPAEIGNLHNLITLDLSNNDITELPDSICNLSRLENLYINSNDLKSLPSSIGNMTSLKNLCCYGNQLVNIPSSIGNLNSLKILYISHNNLKHITSSIGNLKNIQSLQLNHNQLTEIPESIGNLSTLKLLDISNNKLVSIPESIGMLTNLKTLDLSCNQLTVLPLECGNLQSLIKIYLYANRLVSIPSSIGNLHNLESLHIFENYITTIPSSIGNLQRLISFIISNNPIEYIPPNVRRLLEYRQRIAQGVYCDSQSVHNSNVQASIKESIMRLISIPTVIDVDTVISSILSDLTLTEFTKQSLIEYSKNIDLISEVNVTFLEVLTAVWNRIVTSKYSTDIKAVLNSEMADAECKCFTGRVSRLVNCLSGVDELVEVKISDNEQIGNVISVIGDRLKVECRYSIELHKEIAREELIELGYKLEVVLVWLEYIE